MEVYFVDVGQGTSNVILIGKRRAIVIDTGRRASDLSMLLNHLAVDELSCVALSHLDADHAGGAPAILTEFRGRIGRICFPNDHRVLETTFWDKLQSEIKDRHLLPSQLIRMECEQTPRLVWRSNALKAELKLFSPTFGENQVALEEADSNATSGVLVLKVGEKRIVFPGDSKSAQWREIRNRRGSPLPCEVIAVPHHAGVIWPSHWDDLKLRAELKWLYMEAVRAKYAIISVGTSNIDRHPREDVVDVLRGLNVKVVCTQITGQCCTALEKLRPGLLPIVLPGRSRPVTTLTTSNNSRDLACAGTVVADITPSGVTIRRLGQHQKAVDALATRPTGRPLCR
jgi:competence protein ComEC